MNAENIRKLNIFHPIIKSPNGAFEVVKCRWSLKKSRESESDSFVYVYELYIVGKGISRKILEHGDAAEECHGGGVQRLSLGI